MTDPAPLISTGSVLRDDNDTPVQGFGVTLSNSKTLTGNSATVAVPIFHVIGTVQVLAIWGNITTVLGANNTAAYWRLNDQSAQSDITLATGTVLSALPVGSIIVKKGLAAAALLALSASQERVSEPTTLETMFFSPFVVVQKTAGVTTDIEFVYSTTDAPTSGVINFYVQYIPLGLGSKITTA